MAGRQRVRVPGLKPPWVAYMSTKKQQIFYFNHETKESVWEKPVEGDKKTGRKRKRPSEDAESSADVEMIDLDRRVVEPMDVDECEEALTQLRSRQRIEVLPESEEQPCPATDKLDKCPFLAVFDTSSLLNDPTVLSSARINEIVAVLPYTIIRELDRLKESERVEVQRKATAVISRIEELSRISDDWLVLESSFEASQKIEGFICEKNDDFILKCAYTVYRNLLERLEVYFVTDDKNLAVKARSHGLVCGNVEDFKQKIQDIQKGRPSVNHNFGFVQRRSSEFKLSSEIAEEEKKDRERQSPAQKFLRMCSDTIETLCRRKNGNDNIKVVGDIERIRVGLNRFLQHFQQKELSILVDLIVSLHTFYCLSSVFPSRKKQDKTSLYSEFVTKKSETIAQIRELLESCH